MANSSFTPTFSVSDGSVTEPKLAAGATLKLGTEQSLSGASVAFTGIPSGTKQVILTWNGASVNGTVNGLVQLGTSGGLAASGYVSAAAGVQVTPVPFVAASTTGFGYVAGAAGTDVRYGQAVLTLENASTNRWSCHGAEYTDTTNDWAHFFVGKITLSGVLDRVALWCNTNTFDAGSINIAYK